MVVVSCKTAKGLLIGTVKCVGFTHERLALVPPPMLETIGRRGLSSAKGDGRCGRCMRMLGLNESDMDGPNELSSGEVEEPAARAMAPAGGAVAAAPEGGALAGPSASPHLPVVGAGNPVAVPGLAR